MIQDFGFPVLSKEIASKIDLLQNPSEKNATVRHAIITGETGEYGGFRTGTRMQLAQRWLELFGGYENENEGVDYQIPPFKVSSKCCYYLKEKPADDWARFRCECGREWKYHTNIDARLLETTCVNCMSPMVAEQDKNGDYWPLR